MADWTAPFHKPHMTTDEFDEYRRKYVEKHGYTITFPGLDDVFHFGTEKKMTHEEEAHWKNKDYNWFDKDRYEDIKAMKAKRKAQYLSMLSSPSRKIIKSRAAIQTSVDDAQDALSTLSGIGTLAYMIAPKAIKAFIGGPLGWVITAENALNFVNKALAPEQRMLKTKKDTEKATRGRAKAGKAKVKNMEKLLKAGGWKAKAIEALQVSDNVFGVGVSLGALMAFPLDLISGFCRQTEGAKVGVKVNWPNLSSWERTARKAARNWLNFGVPMEEYFTEEHNSPVVRVRHERGIEDVLGKDLMAQMHVALLLSHQVIHARGDSCDPLATEATTEDYELKAPSPDNLLTLEVIKELGDDPRESAIWPATGEKWSVAKDLVTESSKHLTDNYTSYSNKNAHSLTAWAGVTAGTDASLYSLETVCGKGSVVTENSPSYAAINALQWLNFAMEDNVPAEKQAVFAKWLQRCDDTNYTPSGREAVDFAERHCGFGFIQA